MTALGYDLLVTAAMIIIGALVGVMSSTVNPFSIGVAAGEAGISIGDGIGLRFVMWVLLMTGLAFGLMIFSVIPWSSVIGGRAAAADYCGLHEVVGAAPFWFELNWWFPQLAMPLLALLADFARVSRASTSTITAWIMGHGLALLMAPTSVELVGGLAIAKVGYDKYLRFVWPLLLALFAVSTLIIGIAATLE